MTRKKKRSYPYPTQKEIRKLGQNKLNAIFHSINKIATHLNSINDIIPDKFKRERMIVERIQNYAEKEVNRRERAKRKKDKEAKERGKKIREQIFKEKQVQVYELGENRAKKILRAYGNRIRITKRIKESDRFFLIYPISIVYDFSSEGVIGYEYYHFDRQIPKLNVCIVGVSNSWKTRRVSIPKFSKTPIDELEKIGFDREFLEEDRRKSRKRSVNTKWRMGGIS